MIDKKLENNGYIVIAGLIIQWGKHNMNTSNVKFNISFQNKCFTVVFGSEYRTYLENSHAVVITGSLTKEGFKVPVVNSYSIYWIAIGI